jgi:hypothetical protein
MATFILIAKTVLCSVVSAAALAALTAKIETMINPPHAHLGVGMVILFFVGCAVVTSFVSSLIGSLMWKGSLDTNWLKVVIGAVSIAEIVVLFFVFYSYIFGNR